LLKDVQPKVMSNVLFWLINAFH